MFGLFGQQTNEVIYTWTKQMPRRFLEDQTGTWQVGIIGIYLTKCTYVVAVIFNCPRRFHVQSQPQVAEFLCIEQMYMSAARFCFGQFKPLPKVVGLCGQAIECTLGSCAFHRATT